MPKTTSTLKILTSHDGYTIAAKIDKLFSETETAYDITAELNQAGYDALLRTVETTIRIMRKMQPKPRGNVKRLLP